MASDEQWRTYKRELDRLKNRWRLGGGATLAAGMLAIVALGGENGVRDTQYFVFPAVVVAYLLYLKDHKRLSKRAFRDTISNG